MMTLDAGVIAAPGVFGARAELLARIRKDLVGYAAANGEYDFGRNTMGWGVAAGVRGTFRGF